MNQIVAIHPYKHKSTWVFDDDAVELEREPFVSGADVFMELFAAGREEFTMLVSANSFPTVTHEFRKVRADKGGHWYYSREYDREGWLCPALLKYFDPAPPMLYVEVQ